LLLRLVCVWFIRFVVWLVTRFLFGLLRWITYRFRRLPVYVLVRFGLPVLFEFVVRSLGLVLPLFTVDSVTFVDFVTLVYGYGSFVWFTVWLFVRVISCCCWLLLGYALPLADCSHVYTRYVAFLVFVVAVVVYVCRSIAVTFGFALLPTAFTRLVRLRVCCVVVFRLRRLFTRSLLRCCCCGVVVVPHVTITRYVVVRSFVVVRFVVLWICSAILRCVVVSCCRCGYVCCCCLLIVVVLFVVVLLLVTLLLLLPCYVTLLLLRCTVVVVVVVGVVYSRCCVTVYAVGYIALLVCVRCR